MSRFFNQDNPFWAGMERIFDVFVLNLLWLLCCLPIVTIGPATTAFFYALIQLLRGENGYISHDFFRSFRQNFRQGVMLGLPLTAVGAFLVLDITLCYRSGTGIYTFFMVFFAVLFLFWAFLTLYSFPLLAKFEKTGKEILIWAFTLSIRHAARTLLMLAVFAAGLWACHILSGLIFIVFGLTGWFIASQMVRILKPYLPDPCAEDGTAPLTFAPEGMEENQYGEK